MTAFVKPRSGIKRYTGASDAASSAYTAEIKNPLIKKEIAQFYQGGMNILDSSEVVALALKEYLEKHDLLNVPHEPTDHFLVSDYTESFESSARMFFHESVTLEKHQLWD